MSGDHNMNQTDSGWRKRQIALNKKAENARELGLDYDIHSCSYYCDRPECIKAQRDELRDKLARRTWVGLTETRIKEIWLNGKDHGDDWADVLALARSFESELKELNT
jgi:hypothetical protein